MLLVEVSDSSLDYDVGLKARYYAGLGIADYSDESELRTRSFAERHGLTLHVVSLPEDHGYDIPTDKDNNLFLLEFGGTKIGKIDAKTKTLKTWDPDLPHARPRRGHFDKDGNLVYAEYGSNAIGRFAKIADLSRHSRYSPAACESQTTPLPTP